MRVPWYLKLITEVATEMPLFLSIFMKSLVACFFIFLLFTAPAGWMAPPNSRSFSVKVVLPASGWEIIAKVLLLLISVLYFINEVGKVTITCRYGNCNKGLNGFLRNHKKRTARTLSRSRCVERSLQASAY